MNQGMYGMASASYAGGLTRKLVAQLGKGGTLNDRSGMLQTMGVAISSVTTPSGVRTKVLGVSGKGAARVLNIYNATGGTTDLRVECWFDGVKVFDITYVSVSSTSVPIIGFYSPSGSYALTPDWIPFESSYEVFVTSSIVGGNSLQHITDIHQ